jgi:anti-sigma regulatory factor (Ser/Thr protein kinase)
MGGERTQAAAGLLTLTVPCRLDRVGDVRTFIDALDLSPRLSAERIADLKVTASEAAANAIEHAGVEVRLTAWILSDRVVLEIANDGDFKTDGDVHSSGRVRGSGLRLMVSLADKVTFAGLREGPTNVRLTFHNRDRDE